MIAGVCSGIAIHYGWDIALLRIIVVITTILTGGFVLVAYLAAWLVIPDALYALPPNARQNYPA
jgi:phage shock protein C